MGVVQRRSVISPIKTFRSGSVLFDFLDGCLRILSVTYLIRLDDLDCFGFFAFDCLLFVFEHFSVLLVLQCRFSSGRLTSKRFNTSL